MSDLRLAPADEVVERGLAAAKGSRRAGECVVIVSDSYDADVRFASLGRSADVGRSVPSERDFGFRDDGRKPRKLRTGRAPVGIRPMQTNDEHASLNRMVALASG